MRAPNLTEPSYLTVSQINLAFNKSLEKSFPQVSFQGEIAQVTRPSSGHLYLNIKDQDSQLAAVMWKGPSSKLTFKPEVGMAVLCQGRPNVYNKTGKLQVVLSQLLPAGAGLLQKKFLELKAKLEREGLFAVERKRKLPLLPKAVGVVTSATGAVIHDIMVRIHERLPSQQVYLVDVRVQGEGSAQEIAAGIETLNAAGFIDVIIVCRGGGSLEDLWAFNEEAVVRAIFASAVPVVSGVGHEVDVTLADLVADVRAPTPTAAAEIVVPKRSDLLSNIAEFERRLKDTDRWYQPLVQAVDELVWRLEQRISRVFAECSLRLDAAAARLSTIRPEQVLVNLHNSIDLLLGRLLRGGEGRALQSTQRLERVSLNFNSLLQRNLAEKRHAFSVALSRFEGANPNRILERGFSVVESKTGVVRSAEQLEKGDKLLLRFARGRAGATVSDVSS